jgi:DNA-binding response OmpR family regulator
MTRNLLLVDDDAELGSMVRTFFQDTGFCVECESDSATAIERVQTGLYELLILDVMLPGLDGFEVLRHIRKRFLIPVLMLTARTSRLDRITGFQSGADDYLTKPFYPEELLARVEAILRRSVPRASDSSKVLRLGEVMLFPGSRNALYCGRPLDLTAMECEILEQLLRAAGHAVSRDELSLHLYNRVTSPYDRTIDTHVSRIRRKLGAGRNLIASIRGTGYQFCIRPECRPA